MGILAQSPDDLTNQVHSQVNGQTVPVVRTDPQAFMVNDGSNDRVMMGGFGDGNFGIKVSQSGYDVKTATDSQLVMSSGFNSFKIAASGTTSVVISGTPAGTDYSTTVTHNLGYVPAVLAYTAIPSAPATYYLMPADVLTFDGTNYKIYTRITAAATTTTLVFTASASGNVTNGTWPIRYYLLRETAT